MNWNSSLPSRKLRQKKFCRIVPRPCRRRSREWTLCRWNRSSRSRSRTCPTWPRTETFRTTTTTMPTTTQRAMDIKIRGKILTLRKIRTYVCLYVCIYAYTCVCMYVCIYVSMYVCTWVYKYIRKFNVHGYVCMYAHAYTRPCLCMHAGQKSSFLFLSAFGMSRSFITWRQWAILLQLQLRNNVEPHSL